LLPTITDTVSIDGYTQAGAEPDDAITNANSAALKIQLSGINAPSNAFGLAVSGSGAAGTTIKGLVINSFADDGLFINAQNVVIEGNFIGTNAAGTSDLGNGADGVHLLSSGNLVGGRRTRRRTSSPVTARTACPSSKRAPPATPSPTTT
jgi:hypothetical protein